MPLTSKKGYNRLYLGNLLKSFKNDKKYNKDSYALITQITTISKNKIFKDNIRCYCDKNTMDIINKEIVDFFNKIKWLLQ